MNDRILTAKEYLSQAYRIDQRINAKLEQAMRLRSLAQRITTSFGHAPVSRTRNVSSMEDTILKIIEAEKRLDSEVDRFVDTKREIQQTIDLVADADCRLLLEFRYLAMKRWIDVAGEMNICRAYANRLHEKALAMVDTVLRTRSVMKDAASGAHT